MCSKGAHYSSIRGKADEGSLAMQSQAESNCGERNFFRSPCEAVEEGLAGPSGWGTLNMILGRY